MNVMAVVFSGKTKARDATGVLRFVNVRAYAYWALRDMLDPERGQKLALPPDQELLSDLTAPRWSMTMQGIKVEPKEDIVKRLGRSPDCADAVVLAILRPPPCITSGPTRLIAWIKIHPGLSHIGSLCRCGTSQGAYSLSHILPAEQQKSLPATLSGTTIVV